MLPYLSCQPSRGQSCNRRVRICGELPARFADHKVGFPTVEIVQWGELGFDGPQSPTPDRHKFTYTPSLPSRATSTPISPEHPPAVLSTVAHARTCADPLGDDVAFADTGRARGHGYLQRVEMGLHPLGARYCVRPSAPALTPAGDSLGRAERGKGTCE